MIRLFKKHRILIVNILISIFFLALPYFLFKGKFYISGDDTRLYYAFPYEYFKEFTFSSWHHFSSVGFYSSTQFMTPFLLIWTMLELVFKSRLVIDYLSFSLPLILGFLFLQMFISEILANKKSNSISILSSLFFICSPIISINQLFIFLSTIWLIPALPLSSYLFVKFIKTNDYKYVSLAVICWIVFSLALFSIPWWVAFIVPIILGFVVISFLDKFKDVKKYLVRSFIFLLSIAISQSFWLLSFVITYFGKSDINYGSKILSKGVADTFTPTVLATAHSNIIYPLMNLFHRRLVFDFGWDLQNVFVNFYDKTYFLNSLFIGTLFLGLLFLNKYLSNKEKRIYIVFFIAFLFALFALTVNIGPLKPLFLLLGKVPGFVMFRNFYDKFALAYVIFYSVLLALSLTAVRKFNLKLFNIIFVLLSILIIFNFTQVGNIVNAPLWQTKNIYRNIEIPNEYLDFMSQVKKNVSSTNNIFTVPFGTALYSVIKDTNSNSVYTGTSPVKLFSGVNDISGFLSFFFSDAKGMIEYYLINKDYKSLSKILYVYNVNYLFLNTNIPQTVLNSWVFDRRMNKGQGKEMLAYLVDEKPLLSSKNGNYKLYKFKNLNTLISTKNLTFKKINETYFQLEIKNVNGKQDLIFYDSFHPGWKLFINKSNKLNCRVVEKINSITECKEADKYILGDELSYLFKKPVFEKSHKPYTSFFINKWQIDAQFVRDNFTKESYTVNKDGSVNLRLVLYFVPQVYFYIGTILSLFIIGGNVGYLLYRGYKYYENKK